MTEIMRQENTCRNNENVFSNWVEIQGSELNTYDGSVEFL